MAEYGQNIQESILQSIDYLIKDRVSNLALDQTIVCTIVECTNTLTGEYRVQYQDGFFLAYSQNQAGYIKKDLVYVLIPLGDFSNTKIITGKATVTSDRELLSLLEIDKYNYKQTSGNCLSSGQCRFPQGLNSYKVLDGRYLYYKIEEHELTDSILIDTVSQFPQMIFDEDSFKSSLVESKYVKLAGDFRTNLSYAHKLSQYGKYGYAVTFAFKKDNAKIQIKQINGNNIEYYNKEDIYYQTYTLDSDQMIGNPYRFQNSSSQDIIYKIDPTNLLYLKSIQIYSKDFEKDAVIGSDENDIFISNLQIYTVDDATKSDNNYKLIISPLDGVSFSQSDQNLRLKATVIHQEQTDVTLGNQLNYYWFIRDDKINSSSDEYSYLAGPRWRKLSWTSAEITLNEKTNLAYRNEYKLIVTITNTKQDNSPQFILSETIKIFNLVKEYPISLISNKGTTFDFKKGIVKITCLIGEQDGIDNNFVPNKDNNDFSFWWSKTIINSLGEITTTYLKTKEALETELEQALLAEKEALDNNELIDLSLSQDLRKEIEKYNDVEIKRNFFELDTFNIENRVEIGCTVYQKIGNKEYYLGADSIVLNNGEEKGQRGYSIEILNGNQIFQYDEDGISPASNKFQIPQNLYPLEIKFYSPEGELIDPKLYDYFWIIPIKNTMFDFELDFEDFFGNEEFKTYYEDILPIQIKNEYDNTTINNQVRVQLRYNNEDFSENSNFTFLKVGENGTNGTQYVGKIVSKYEPLNNSLLTIITNNGANAKWNVKDNLKLSDYEARDILQFEKYYNGQLVNILSTDNISWEISGINSRLLSFNDSKVLEFYDKQYSQENDDNTKYLINQIVKATLAYLDENGNTRYLYAFLGIPHINYLDDVNYNIFFDKNKTLREVIYDNDGTNPSYNSNLGFSFSWDYQGDETKFLAIKPMGGYDENPDSASFELLLNKYDKAQSFEDTSTWSYEYSNWANTAPGMIIPITKDKNSFECYISPKEYYDGEYNNQCIIGRIYNNRESAEQELLSFWNYRPNSNCEVQFYMPIKFSLNVYGLGFLNNWDGNNIKINNEDGYILAPQIGAGQKNDDNTFTGVLLGQEKTYFKTGSIDKKVGILGYSKGRRSIFLDAETGRAEFGRERTRIDKERGVQCGRIILDPEGVSSIGSWIIGNNSLYNIKNKKGQSSSKLGPGYEDLNFTNNHIEDIQHEDSGILISADPAYISVKGSSNTTKNALDIGEESLPESLELQIDPNQASLFSIFGHYKTKDGWERRLKVGIDANGRFFANSLQNNYSNLNVSAVNAFGSTTEYIGMVNEVNFGEEIDSENKVTVFKAFIPKKEVNTIAPLYISGGNLENEYARPMQLYGKEFKIFTSGTSTSTNDPRRIFKEAENSFIITDELFELGHKELIFESSENSETGEITHTFSGYKVNNKSFPYEDTAKAIEGNIFRGFSIQKEGDFNLFSENNFNFYGKDFSFINSEVLTFNKPLILYINGKKVELGFNNSSIESKEIYRIITERIEVGVGNDDKDKDGNNGNGGFWIRGDEDSNIDVNLRDDGDSNINVGGGFYIGTGDGPFNIDSPNGFEVSTGNGQFNIDSDGNFSMESNSGESSTLIDKNGLQIDNGKLIADYAEFKGKKSGTNNSVEASYNIQGADFSFISDPIYQSNKQNTELGKELQINSAKSMSQQLNAIYSWSKVVSQWYQEFQDFKNDFNDNFRTQYSTDIAGINNRLSLLASGLAKVEGKLGAEENPDKYGPWNEEAQTQHKIISSKEFYATDFIRENDTVYFIVDE